MPRKSVVRMLSLATALLVASITTGTPGSPRRSEAETDAQAALRLFKESEVAYLAGRFDRAVALLDEAYQLHPSPTLLYNRARALEGLGDLAGAVASYRRYLAEERDARDRGALEQRIATLNHQLAEREALRSARERADRARVEAEARLRLSPQPAPPSRARRAAPWIVAALGGAGLVIGGGLAAGAVSAHDSAVRDGTAEGAQQSQSSAMALSLGANVSLIGGGILAGAGVIWVIVDAVRFRARPSSHPNAGGGP